jgi:hypothetical protein
VVTRTLAPLLIVLLAASGCGGGDDAEAKQAALAPAPKATVQESDVDEPATPAAKPAEVKAEPKKVDDAKGSPMAAAPSDSVTTASVTPADSTEPAPEQGITGRESFSYTGGSRDPFASLLNASRVGPELPDLVLVAIYYDTRNPNGSVVVLREKVGNRKYNLRPGDRLGRMRVSTVGPKDVTFSIDDFGTERQETVSLRKQEEVQ